MTMMRVLIVAAVSYSLLACASSAIFLSQEAKKKLTAVSVSDTVTLPRQPLFAAARSALVNVSSVQPNAMVNYLQKNNIDVAAIVKDSFIKQAAFNKVLAGKLQPQADSVIELKVLMYGLGQKEGISSEYKPILSVLARMKDPSEKVIWEQYDFVTVIGGNSPARTLEQYFSSPDIFQTAFKTAADNVVSQLLEDLN